MTDQDTKRRKNMLQDLNRMKAGLPVPIRTDGGIVIMRYERVPAPSGGTRVGFGGHIDADDLDAILPRLLDPSH